MKQKIAALMALAALLPAMPTHAEGLAISMQAQDVQLAARAFGFRIKGSQILDGCDIPLEAPERADLNGDGVPELIFTTGTCDAGFAGWFGIASRDAAGRWRSVLEGRGVYQVLDTRHFKWRDVVLGLPGPDGSHKFRWNGSAYDSATIGNSVGARAQEYQAP